MSQPDDKGLGGSDKMNNEKSVILVVDDVPDNLTLATSLLKHLYKVKVATSGEAALV